MSQCPVPAVPRQRIKIVTSFLPGTTAPWVTLPGQPSDGSFAVQAARAQMASRLQHESWLRNRP